MRNSCWEEVERALSPVLPIFFLNITAGTERKGITFTGKGESGERLEFVWDQARDVAGEAPLYLNLVMFDLFAIGRLLEIAI
jgi:hypothetical protein